MSTDTPALAVAGGRGAARPRSRRQPSRLARAEPWLVPTIVVLLILGIWEAISRLGIVDPIILPPFTDVMSSLWSLIQTGYFWSAVKETAIETLAGFAIGVSLAMVGGSLIGMFKLARHALYPPAVAFQITPRVAMAPLFLTWFGFGITSRIVMAAALCFFPVLINVVVGLENSSSEAQTFLRSLGASKWQAYRKLYLPSSMPLIFAGLKNAVTLALIGAIVAEFVGGSEGMGVLIKNLNFQLDVSQAFAVIVALMLFGLILYGVMELLDKKLIFWRSH